MASKVSNKTSPHATGGAGPDLRAGKDWLASSGTPSRESVGLEALWTERERLIPSPQLSRVFGHVWRAGVGMVRAPLTAVLTLLCIAVSLFVLAALMLLTRNAERALSGTRAEVSLAAVVRESVSDEAAETLRFELSQDPRVLSVALISKKEALKLLEKELGQDAVILEGLEDRNPLPRTFEIALASDDEAKIRALVDQLHNNPHIELVQYDEGLLARVAEAVQGLTALASFSIAVVLLLAAFVMASAITLSLYAHRDEIEIMRMVGATDAYIRGPYVVEGLVQGVGGALLALAVLYLCARMSSTYLHDSFLSLFFGTEIAFLSVWQIMAVAFTGAAVGIGGSFLAALRFRGA